jgi:hypothetical protein
MRELKSANEIRSEVARIVREEISSKGKVDTTEVGFAQRHPAPDRNGCNWYISHFKNAGDHMSEVGTALASVKKRWNLAD